MKFLLYSFFLLVVAPCNNAKKATASKPAADENSKAVITYQTTPCFGRCPLYTLTINGETKTATYVGTQHTEKTGTYTKTISAKELDEFVKAFEAAGFWTLNDEYLGNITDFPIKYITYSNHDKSKKIKTRSGVPENLTRIEKMLAEYADSEGWKKSEDASNSKD